jgi:hypothetical protein
LNASGDLDVRDVVADGSQQDVTFQGAGDGTNPATDTIIDANGVDRGSTSKATVRPRGSTSRSTT